MKRINVDLEDGLYARLRSYAFLTDRKISVIIRNFLDEMLPKNPISVPESAEGDENDPPA